MLVVLDAAYRHVSQRHYFGAGPNPERSQATRFVSHSGWYRHPHVDLAYPDPESSRIYQAGNLQAGRIVFGGLFNPFGYPICDDPNVGAGCVCNHLWHVFACVASP